MVTKYAPTWVGNIYVGYREEDTGLLHNDRQAEEIARKFCLEHDLCLTFTPTRFLYATGWEPGCIVGLINEPANRKTSVELTDLAQRLATIYQREFRQQRVTVLTNHGTLTLETKPAAQPADADTLREQMVGRMKVTLPSQTNDPLTLQVADVPTWHDVANQPG